MPHTRLRPSFSLTDERLAELRAVVPEAFADGKINWPALREALGEHTEEERGEAEHFGLFWPGKRAARRLASIPSRGTMVPMPGSGVNEEVTRNFFIEGDNLEVLKLLQKPYAGRVKMIYIDPPYNTGNDFVYNDDFTDPLGDYFRKTGQADDEGKLLTTNTRADGRFHSNWLSMMYPRLRLARELLSDDGLIFVSIDDTEQYHCRQLMNELFGEENFVECFIWKKSYGGGAKEKYVVRQHEYVLLFARSRETLASLWLPPDKRVIDKYYKYKDERFSERGPYRVQPLEAAKSMGARPNLVFPVPHPKGGVVRPKRQWLWSRDRVMAALARDELVFTGGGSGATISYKQYLKDEEGTERGSKPTSVLDGPYTQEGTSDLSALFAGTSPFPYPKPVALIKRFVQLAIPPDDVESVVLDFFAGSCTTGQAVLELNREDGGLRRFICIQMNERLSDSGYSSVAEIGRERLRRVGKRMNKETKAKPTEDLGFKALTLSKSCFEPWADYSGADIGHLESLFEAVSKPLRENCSPNGLLVEVMLLEGFPLDSAVAALVGIKGNQITSVTSDHCGHRLLTCFDKQLKDSTVNGLDLQTEDVLVCLDNALNDEQKLRLADRCSLKTI